ncbi:SHOCT domain-containing protein [Colwellia psychrerythraea]|uniref:SHOCT domain-containing protein n=1 Tax=Colwellia psychrerythraea TaxID=28229 RepID=A0A099L6S8_COLPS|nr:SHOCT domain-containing protein [Colwellia psychrerythraea]KGJ97588.1 hypothetical protein GAB14E_1177 [Colwellia psychrerythraea]
MLTVNKIHFVLFLLCLLFTTSSNARNAAVEKNNYLLQKIAQAPQLENQENQDNQWIQLLEQPGNSQHYYLASKEGKIYQLEQDNPNGSSLLVDLQQRSAKNAMLVLSAFALHPNFSQRDQSGYGTFYTAHVEKTQKVNTTKRLQDSAISTPLNYDAIVTEWKLTQAKQVNISSQREVLRIAIANISNNISQLSFNPYSKSWHDDFAQLYIALSQSPKLIQYPLYSGVILRIDPQEISTASYSVPHGNPFFANKSIDETIYLLGAGQIRQFIWPDKYSKALLISHIYNFKDSIKNWLSYSYGGEDWRLYPPKSYIYQHKKLLAANSLLVYRGQNAPALRNKLLLLSKNKHHWQLSSLAKDHATTNINRQKVQKLKSSPELEWPLQQAALLTNQLTLFRDNRGELLFFNRDSGAIYQLFQQDITQGQAYLQANEESSISGFMLFLVIFFSLLGGYIYYQVNIQQNSAKSLVRREFSNLTLTDDKSGLNLFRRHQHEAEKVLALTDIKQCQFWLGDLAIETINTTLGHGFNDQKEQALRKIFHNEQVAKMVDGKVRRISLTIKSSEKNKQVICLYLRKGSDRITKKGYFTVVEDVIDWCWLIANTINAEYTGKRIFKSSTTPAEIAQTDHKIHDDTPLHAQAAIIRPATHPKPLISSSDNEDKPEIKVPQDKIDGKTSHEHHDNSAIESAKVETDLVNALEKLVKLQQQGFLTAQEFEQAKTKLLHSLNETD